MNKIKVINLELLYLYDEGATSTDITNQLRRITVEEMYSAANNGYEHIVFLLLIDGFLYKNNRDFIDTVDLLQTHANNMGIKSISFMPGMAENYPLKQPIKFFDFHVWLIYQSYKDKPTAEWNSSSDKFLFLTGQPARFNRVYLVNEFYKSGLLANSMYSFFPAWTDHDIEWSKNFLGYTTEQYNEFVANCQNTFDSLYDESKNYSKLDGPGILRERIYDKPWIKDPGLLDIDFFSQTCFSVVSEGNAFHPATDYAFLTEKTWRAVINKHPFIIAGYKEQVLYAKQQGLKTFEEYFDIKDYYLIDDEKERMKAVVHNTEYFVKHFKNRVDEIKMDIEHNYNLFFKILEENKKAIENFEQEDIEKYFNSKTWTNLIRIPKIQ